MRFKWVVILGLQCCAVAVSAQELTGMQRALFEGFQTYRRTAVGYLRTNNIDLAAIEIERLRDRWNRDRAALQAKDSPESLAKALSLTEESIVASLQAVDKGDADGAREILERAPGPLDAWRRAHSIRMFSDCIEEVRVAYGELDVHRRSPPDLALAAPAESILRAAANTISAVERCDAEAPMPLRKDPEFRRLADGMAASLRQVPEAVRARDGALLYRLLIEQLSFERLLTFRYG